MLSILLALVAACFCFISSKKNPSQRWWSIGFLVFFNWFIIELAIYFYLLYVVHCGNFIFLIGNQKFLDAAIKKDIVERLSSPKDAHNSFYHVDPDLGYTVGKNKSFWVYHSNSQGIRSDKEYTQAPSPKAMRIAVFGDSFVFCDGEPNETTWPSILEQTVDGLEVMNFGVSGYGLSQSYLRYLKDGVPFNPDVIFVNYVLLCERDWFEGKLIGGTDVRRSTLYRPLLKLNKGDLSVQSFTPLDFFDPALREDYLYKHLGLSPIAQSFWKIPIFSFTNTGLAIKNFYMQNKFVQVLKSQGQDTQVESKQLAYNEAVLKKFVEATAQHHTSVIFFGEWNFQTLPPSIQNILKQNAPRVIYMNSKELLKLFFNKFNLQPKDYFNNTRHYNMIGNRVYAAALGMILENNIWGGGDRTFQFCTKSRRFQNITIEPCG